MISIIIPLYNREKIFSKTLDGVLAQTYKNYEVVVVNDGSSDNSLDVARSYEDKFWSQKIRYKVIDQENKGGPAARNRGLREARGEYVIFCDSDAVLWDDALEIMLNTLKQNLKASYAYPSHKYGWKLFRLFPFEAKKLRQMPYVHSTALIRKEDLPKNGWDEKIKKLQDWDLFLTMLEEGHEGIWIDKVLFRIEPGGVYSTWVPSFVYKLMPFLPSVKKYKRAVEIIKEKHNL